MLKRVISLFFVELFRLTVSKNAVGEPFSLSLISGTEKVWIRMWRMGEYLDFP